MYKYRSWKNRVKHRIYKNKTEDEKLLKDIGLVYERCGDLSLNCNRWKIKSKDEFTAALESWQGNEPNPIMAIIYNKIGEGDKLYTSLYKYPKEYTEYGYVLNYISYGGHAVYAVLDKKAVDHKLAVQSYGYTTLINRLIVNSEFEKIEKAIDLFCKTLKKKEGGFIS